jgi:hypothetical protein
MQNIDRNCYIQAMTDPFTQSSDVNEHAIATWAQSSLITHEQSDEETEVQAKAILKNLKHLKATSSKRYRFKEATAREELLSYIFKRSLATPAGLEITERFASDQNRLYPTWKKVIWIQIPKNTALSLNNTKVKIVVTATFTVLTLLISRAAYHALKNFMQGPIPLNVIRYISLKTMALYQNFLEINWTKPRIAVSVLGIGLIKLALSAGITGPSFTTIVKTMFVFLSKLNFTLEHQGINSFLLLQALSIMTFGWKTCVTISQSCNKIAHNSEQERLALCKEQALPLWKAATASRNS